MLLVREHQAAAAPQEQGGKPDFDPDDTPGGYRVTVYDPTDGPDSLSPEQVMEAVSSVGGVVLQRGLIRIGRNSIVVARLTVEKERALRAVFPQLRIEKDARRYPIAPQNSCSPTCNPDADVIWAHQAIGIRDAEGKYVAEAANVQGAPICLIDSGWNTASNNFGPCTDYEGSGTWTCNVASTSMRVSGVNNPSQTGIWYEDGDGHGSHCAGIMTGMKTGVVPKGVRNRNTSATTDAYVVDVFNDRGVWKFYASDIAAALQYCVDELSMFASMSLGGFAYSQIEKDGVDQFTKNGGLVIAAAGNDGDDAYLKDQLHYPSCYDAVISVGATAQGGSVIDWSQANMQTEVVAPGVNICSSASFDCAAGDYVSLSGTSMAAPQVTGVLALLAGTLQDVDEFPTHPSQQEMLALREALRKTAGGGHSITTACGLSADSIDDKYKGFGEVNFTAAYECLKDKGWQGDIGTLCNTPTFCNAEVGCGSVQSECVTATCDLISNTCVTSHKGLGTACGTDSVCDSAGCITPDSENIVIKATSERTEYLDQQYSINGRRRWVFAGRGNEVQLEFSRIDLESYYDYMYVYDGLAVECGELVGTYNGAAASPSSPLILESTKGGFTVIIQSDYANNGGFDVFVQSLGTPAPTPAPTPDESVDIACSAVQLSTEPGLSYALETGVSSGATTTDAEATITCTVPPDVAKLECCDTYEVPCQAIDPSGNTASCNISVTVVDGEAPLISCPADITEAKAAADLPATYILADATATDNVDAVTPTTESSTTLTFNGFGSQTVTWSVTDQSSNSASCSTVVVVTDAESVPLLTCPDPITADATATSNGTVVTFSAVASDDYNPNPEINCDPASGSVFSLNIASGVEQVTTVECTAWNGFQYSTPCTFGVTIQDNTQPDISCPSDTTISSPVDYEYDFSQSTTASDNSGYLKGAIVCTPISFAVGTQKVVTCSVSDNSDNIAQCTFSVSVTNPTTGQTPANENQLMNGNFEEANLAGWSNNGFVEEPGLTGSGAYGDQDSDTLTQTITDTNGDLDKFEFWLKGKNCYVKVTTSNGGISPGTAFWTSAQGGGGWGVTPLQDIPPHDAGHSVTIELTGAANNRQCLYDDVRIFRYVAGQAATNQGGATTTDGTEAATASSGAGVAAGVVAGIAVASAVVVAAVVWDIRRRRANRTATAQSRVDMKTSDVQLMRTAAAGRQQPQPQQSSSSSNLQDSDAMVVTVADAGLPDDVGLGQLQDVYSSGRLTMVE